MAGESLAAGLEGKIGLFSYLNFLIHPSQPDFKDYTGTYPQGLRDNIANITQLASTFGYDIDLSANISATLNSMDGDDFFGILYDADIVDNPETEHDERIRFEEAQFVALMENESIRDAFEAIAISSIGENPTLGALLAFQKNNIDLSALKVGDQTLTGQPIASLNAETIAPFVDGLSQQDTITLLSSLPLSSDDPEEMTQPKIIAMLAAGRPGKNEAIVIPPDTSLAAAIEMRVQASDTWLSFESTARNEVFDSIHAGIKTNLTTVIANTNQQITSGELISGLSPQQLYAMLADKLKTEEGRAEVRAALADENNIRLLRENLADMDFKSLIQFMPNEMVDAQMSNAIRDFVQNNDLAQSIIGIAHGFFEWLGDFLRGNGFDGIADTIDEARDISNVLRPEAASKYQEQFRGAADPKDTIPEPKPEPDTDPTLVQPAHGGRN